MEPDLSWGDIKICRNCSAICPNAATCSRRKKKADALFYDHAQQPADVEARSAQHRMQTVAV